MGCALESARRGEGAVEPNPMVGCVIVRDGQVVGQGWHQRFGGPHAEVEAIADAGERARGATLFVTLEPCSHQGKTPPCVQAIAAAGLRRVVVAQQDPNPRVNGRGIKQLRGLGLQVELGLCEAEARALNAPYWKLVQTRLPWVIAKWAMTLDGRIATRTGDSKWISAARSRQRVHQLRGRVDAILVGRKTAAQDDPLLTARPPGPRVATRIVLDSQARLSLDSQLVRTASAAPVLVATGPDAPEENCTRLARAGCEVFPSDARQSSQRLGQLLAELGGRQMTNVLIEGGGELLGTAFDAGAVDEVHVFMAAKIVGGSTARSPVLGQGVARLAAAIALDSTRVEQLDGDLYISGRVGGDAQGLSSDRSGGSEAV